MHFPKDILIIDFEGMDQPVQVGALLLDKDTLTAKKEYVSYIWADLQGKVKSVSGISQADLKGAPSKEEVGKQLFETFGTEVILATWVAVNDIHQLSKLISAAGLDMRSYDYHVLDLWSVAYLYLLRAGYDGGMRSEEMFKVFGVKPRGLHDALEDCRIEAEILRKIATTGR